MTNIITILKTELANSQYQALVQAQDYPGLASQLNNRPLIANPTPQTAIPKIPGILDLFNAVTPAEAISIYQIPGLVQDIRNAITNGTLQDLQAYLTIAGGMLSANSKTAVSALLAQTQPDPNYQTQISSPSRAEVLGIYPVTPAQVQEALN